MRRLTILLATLAALLVLPVAQAAAGTLTLKIAGTGSGEVSSVGGFEETSAYEGSPPIECDYTTPGPATGVCKDTMSDEGEGFETTFMTAFPDNGSVIAAWNIVGIGQKAQILAGCSEEFGGLEYCAPGPWEPEQGFVPGDVNVTAIFCLEGEALEECEAALGPEGPTNRRTLTLTKSPDGNLGQGLGTVSSKPKGIKCAQYCNEAVGRFYKEQAVVLTAAPSGETSAFDKWVGCPTPEGLICKVPAGIEDVSIEAVFKGSSKAFSPAEALTLSKGESEQNFGWGTIKATGLTCETECDGTTVLYQGPIGGLKPKPGKVVILKEAPAFGSAFVGWSGCTPISATECEVKMEAAEEVTAEFADLPDFALTVEKKYEGGLGSVSSKPKGIACGTTCTSTSANMPEGSSILLTAKPATTEPATTFVKWEGGDCNGKTEVTCTVGMDKAETVKAVFSGPVKPINNAKSLTLSKEGTGYGTVKASGLTCEVLCTSATSLYYGPVTLPKPKAGAKVVLKATPAPGSTAVEWTGCKVLNATECEVVMETNASVSATFDELE